MFKKLILGICLAIFIGQSAYAQPCQGGLVTSQEQLDSLYSGCLTVNGDLIIGDFDEPNDIDNLDALSELFHVIGNFVIQNTLIDTLDHFTQFIATEKSIVFQNNPNLKVIDIEKFGYVGISVAIYDNPELIEFIGEYSPTIEWGFINIENNPKLSSLDVFKNIKFLDGAITISDCPSLKDLSGFDSLLEVPDLVIKNCDSLSNLEHISQVREGFDFKFINLPIKDLNFLKSLDTIVRLTIEGCTKIKDVSELYEWKGSLGNFIFSDTDSLELLDNLDSISISGGLQLSNHKNLTAVDFNQISSLYSLVIEGNEKLDLENGFNNLQSIQEELIISDNNSLKSLDAFNSFASLNTDNFSPSQRGIELRNLPELESINFFPNLEYCNGYLEVISCGMDSIVGLNELVSGPPRILINNTEELKSISGFKNIVEARSVSYGYNPELESITGINKLEKTEDKLSFKDNETLNNIDSAPLFEKGSILIQGSPILSEVNNFNSFINPGGSISISDWPWSTIDIFPNLESFTGIYIGENPFLENLESLNYPKLDTSFSSNFIDIRIVENESLINLSGLDSLGNNTIGRISIEGNSLLTSLKGLSNVVEIGDCLNIYDNDNLTQLGELKNIRKVTNSLTLTENELLKDITALQELEEVYRFIKFSNNPNLENCEFLCLLGDSILYDGPTWVEIENNGDSCSVLEDVLFFCEEDTTSTLISVFERDEPPIFYLSFGSKIKLYFRQ